MCGSSEQQWDRPPWTGCGAVPSSLQWEIGKSDKIVLATSGKTGVILPEKMFMGAYFVYEIKLNWANPPKGGDAKPDGSNAVLSEKNTL